MSDVAALKAVIFDLDGIICDTSCYHAQAWGDLVRGLGCEPPADLEEQVKGISRLASLKIALGKNAARFSDAELEKLASRKNDCYLAAIKRISPSNVFPGVTNLFANLKKAGIKIVMGSASKNARTVLAGLKLLDAFDAIADGFAYKHGKPHPDVFLSAAEAVNAEPWECVVIEDATAGINAALDGGFVTVGMGAYESLKHAHRFVNNLEELDVDQLRALHAEYRSDRWRVVREGTAAKSEGTYGTIFCIGNGFMGVRGSLPGTGNGFYVAGLYDRVDRGPQKPETWPPFEAYWGNADLARDSQIEVCLINSPDFLKLSLAVDGQPVRLDIDSVKAVKRTLDMHNGTYTAELECGTADGKRLLLTHRRFADTEHPHRVYGQYTVEPLNFSGRLRVSSTLDGTTTSAIFVNQKTYDVTAVEAVGEQAAVVEIRGRRNGMEAAFGLSLHALDRPKTAYRINRQATGAEIITDVDVEQNKLFYFEQVMVANTARLDPKFRQTARQELLDAVQCPFSDARIESIQRWNEYWKSSDVRIEGNVADQLGIRFSIYHLLIAGSSRYSGVSIPAKSLSGEAYRGMVFWDTDIHMTPFFNFTQPEMARNLALFRCRTLDGARRKAVAYGFRGASYPWETGVSGNEECEKWLKLITHQSHITADVALAIQRYVDCTGDISFYEDHAAEVLIETSRFWVSKAVKNADGSYSIPNAAGPDEFHVVCNDSAYVCNLAAYNLRLTDEAVRHLKKTAPGKLAAIMAKCGATEADCRRFPEVATHLRTMRRDDGLFEQCAGYFKLRDGVFEKHGGPRPFETQCVKQADVIMMLYLLADQWSADDLRVNYRYYEPRTIHASSLSYAVHGIVAARLGMGEAADKYIRRSLGMDLNDEMGNAAGGAHMAANGMNWLAIVQGYGGCRPRGDVFMVEAPQLPKDWSRLCFRLKWRGADFEVDLSRKQVVIRNDAKARPLPLNLCGKEVEVRPGAEAVAEV